MAAKGYRAQSEGHHKIVVNFCAAYFEEQIKENITYFNRLRVRRHDIVYGEIDEDSVGENEAREAIKYAQEFAELIKKKIIT